jgi:hypothetical protein
MAPRGAPVNGANLGSMGIDFLLTCFRYLLTLQVWQKWSLLSDIDWLSRDTKQTYMVMSLLASKEEGRR